MLVKVCLCVLANLDDLYPWAHIHNISKNKHTDLGLLVWSSDIENMTMTPELNLIRDQHQLFWECIWIRALVLIVHEPLHPMWPAPALYGTIDPLTPLHFQLSVFNLPSNSDDFGLHIDVVFKASLCFACVWIYRCRCPRERRRMWYCRCVNECVQKCRRGWAHLCACVCVFTYECTVYVCVCSYQINPET